MSFRPYIKDMGLKSGAEIRPYDSSRHDSLRISSFKIGGFVSENDLELLKLYYGMSESMQRAIKEIMIVTQENRE